MGVFWGSSIVVTVNLKIFVSAGMNATQPFISAWQLSKYLAQHSASASRATARTGQVLLIFVKLKFIIYYLFIYLYIYLVIINLLN